jgi:hypothetical protein
MQQFIWGPIDPLRVQELLKYVDIIRTAAARFGGWGWRTYDRQFRIRQESRPNRSWSIIDGELWAFYVTTPVQRNFGMGENQSRGLARGGLRTFRGQKSGFGQNWGRNTNQQCFDFNRAGCSRTSCIYKHACSKCNGQGHGAQSCKQGVKKE